MRRLAWLTAILLALAAPAHAQGSLPPHAWLFGAWTGGIFPPPSTVGAECIAQPVVIFTRDLVMRGVVSSQYYTQRLIETARSTPAGAEFRFAQSAPSIAPGPFGLSMGSTGSDIGFGCISPDILQVKRRTDNEISFPGCSDFPYPLVRCPGR